MVRWVSCPKVFRARCRHVWLPTAKFWVWAWNGSLFQTTIFHNTEGAIVIRISGRLGRAEAVPW